MIPQTKTFTLKNDKGRSNSILTKCGVSIPYIPNEGIVHPPISDFLGLWDTGATGTVISKNVIDKLQLIPFTKLSVCHGAGESIANCYKVNLFLPNNVAFSTINAVEGVLTGFDVLIGMDVITQGDFAISNYQGKTTFSFRIPSAREIDFAKEVNEQKNTPEKHEHKAQRNDPCPCGSGKKYKNCHGKGK